MRSSSSALNVEYSDKTLAEQEMLENQNIQVENKESYQSKDKGKF